MNSRRLNGTKGARQPIATIEHGGYRELLRKDDLLTLTTHAIVGAAITGLVPSYPLLGLSLAFASHFVLDALPHWDYPIRSSSITPSIGARMKYDWMLCADLLTIGGDAVLGTILAVVLFTTQAHANLTLILGGAFAAMLPDALQFAYMRFPHQPLSLIQRFHEWIHTARRLRGRPVLGVASQFAFVIVFLITVHTLLPN
jgi:hypothetical protein